MSSQQQSTSYAGAAKAQVFPTKDQAILIDTIEGIPLKDCIVAVAEKVTPEAIRFASRISNNRVCIYLATKSIADDLVYKYKTLLIRGNTLTIRPLIAKNKRIIISNVHPTIHHDSLLSFFESINVKPTSDITFLKTSPNDCPWAHIMSFRRQIYVHPDDVEKIPESCRIAHEGTTYVIFLSPESPACFLCKKEGHQARNCPKKGPVDKQNEASEAMPPQANEIPAPSPQSGVEETSVPQNHDYTADTDSQADFTEFTMEQETPSMTFKRPLPTSPPPNQQVSIQHSRENIDNLERTEDFPRLPSKQTPPTHQTKKRRAEKKENDLDASMLAIETAINTSPENFPLSSIQFSNFLEKARGNKNPLYIVHEFTQDVESIVRMLRHLHKVTTNRSLKVTFTRIVNRLLNNKSSETTSDASEIEDETTMEESAEASSTK